MPQEVTSVDGGLRAKRGITPRRGYLQRLGVFLAGVLAGCNTPAGKPISIGLPQPAPPMVRPLSTGTSQTSAAGIPVARSGGPEILRSPTRLEDLLALALSTHPELAIARAKADAARGKLIQAGLYPNPIIGIDIQQIGLRKTEGQPGISFSQEIVTNGKLDLAQAAAAQGVTAADWHAITQWYDVTARIQGAFYDVITAQKEVLVAKELVNLAKTSVETNERLKQAGTVGTPDVLRARVELYQMENRLQIAQQREAASGKLLAAAVGKPESRLESLEGDLDQVPPEYNYDALLSGILLRSSEVQEAKAAVVQAQRELDLAGAQVYPNVEVGLTPGYDLMEKNPILTGSVSVAVPIFNRNQGNIVAARAELARTTHATQQVQIRLAERVATAYQRFEAARASVNLYEKQVLPDAVESLRLIRLGFDTGDPKFDFNAVLDAQRTLANSRLLLIQARGDVWKAVSEIEGLLQRNPAPYPGPAQSNPSSG